MDELLKAALAVLGAAVIALAAWIYTVGQQLATFRERLDRLQSEIGTDSHSGIRGKTHKRRGQILVIAQHIDLLREKAGMRALDLAESFRKDDD